MWEEMFLKHAILIIFILLINIIVTAACSETPNPDHFPTRTRKRAARICGPLFCFVFG